MPDRDAPLAIVIHDAFDAADHEHCGLVAVTSTLRVPPSAPTDSWLDETRTSHATPCCEMTTCGP